MVGKMTYQQMGDDPRGRDKPRNLHLSIVIITRNAQQKLADALASVKSLAEETIVVDGASTDSTVAIAKEHGSKILEQKGNSFSDWRNQGLEAAGGDWILYLDADERLTSELSKEIKQITSNQQLATSYCFAYAIPRRNIILGKEMKHGGWWPDYVKRLFVRKKLHGWEGELHEEPVFEGELGYLKNPLLHYKHDNLAEMVEKTNEWSEIEANLLFAAGHPPMQWWRFFRVMGGELWLRLVRYRAFLDGPEGVIYAFYQMWSRFVTYAKLWEMQLQDGIRSSQTK